MGFWSFLRPKPDAPASERSDGSPASSGLPTEAPRPNARPPRAGAFAEPSQEIAALLRVGLPGGPTTEEAVATFERLRSTTDEAAAVLELVRTAQARPLPEALLLVLAKSLVDRGDPDVALRVLAPASSAPALVLMADLAAERGDVPRALSFIERVLLRELDHPGARERHRRFRASLGFDVNAKPRTDGATVVTREPDAPFDLLREIGRGGAGAVYEAIDRELGRHVALKVYHQPERDRAQLTHEAQVAVGLEGDGVVRVFDIDPQHGWLALEWAPLGTLRDHVRARDLARLLPIERWALPLARALARTHAAGWVHHDVKPANVLLARDASAILTDFGSARRTGEPSPPGSLGYLSPERVSGRASDPRDDLYGFGRVLEDVLVVVGDRAVVQRFRPLADACLGPSAQRPADGRALLTRLKVEFGIG